MPVPTSPLRKLGFLTIGLFDAADPRAGHESTLEIIELGERLGFDSAWVRHRHLQYGISSPVAVLAAATQRTSRIELGTAVIPLGWENPLRLAEDLATVDILSGGRLNPGVSVGPPMHYDRSSPRSTRTPRTPRTSATQRVRRLLRLRPRRAGHRLQRRRGLRGRSPTGSSRTSPGLGRRLWYGGASLRSARWAGENGMNFLTSSVVQGRGVGGLRGDPAARTSASSGRTTPTASAPGSPRAWWSSRPTTRRPRSGRNTRSTPRKRTPRTATPQGPARMMFAPDLVGTAAEIAERLYAHAAFREIDEVAFALPFTFDHDDYVQILTDIAGALGPALGWRPATS